MRWEGFKRSALLAAGLLVAIVSLLALFGWPNGDPPPSRPADPLPGTRAAKPAPLPTLPGPEATPEVPAETPSGTEPRFRIVDGDELRKVMESGRRGPLSKEEVGKLLEAMGQLPPARVLNDPDTGRPTPTKPGRARKLPLADLLRDGLDPVEGTRELTGERKPKLDEGIPVALTGRVVEKETGEPVEGASVILRSTFFLRRVFYDHHLLEVARGETDSRGEFAIQRLNVDPVHFGKGGLVVVSVTSPDHSPLPPVVLRGVTPGYENRMPDLVVSRVKHRITGRVLDYWEGKPVVGGRVVATGEILPINYPKDQREALFLSAPEATTDEKGRFVLENVGPGKQYVSVHGGDDCAGYTQVTVPMKGEVVLRSRQIRGRIEGKVLDAEDRPIAVVKVDGGDNTTHTFADGKFVLENFRGDVVNLVFTHPDYETKRVLGVENGAREVLVRLVRRWPEMSFVVRDHGTDAPIEIVSIRLRFEGDEKPPLPASPHSVSKQGVHKLRVPDGAVAATVAAEGYEEQVVFLSGVAEGEIREVVLRRSGG